MKFRFVDQITAWEANTSLSAVKAVSFEEYCLRQPLGLPEALPESLITASFAAMADWLAQLSTDFRRRAVFAGAEKIAFLSSARPGDRLRLRLSCSRFSEADQELEFSATATIGAQTVASLECGRASLIATTDLSCPEDGRTLFSEIFRPDPRAEGTPS